MFRFCVDNSIEEKVTRALFVGRLHLHPAGMGPPRPRVPGGCWLRAVRRRGGVQVIEKAYKKLRLDALVIQQGRLTDNVKGVNKDDLLQMVRYGAEKVFSGGTVPPPLPPPLLLRGDDAHTHAPAAVKHDSRELCTDAGAACAQTAKG